MEKMTNNQGLKGLLFGVMLGASGYLAGIAGALALLVEKCVLPLLVGVLGCFAVTCKKPCISGTFCVFSFLIGTLALNVRYPQQY